jgi:hypothetical protein
VVSDGDGNYRAITMETRVAGGKWAMVAAARAMAMATRAMDRATRVVGEQQQ